MENIKTEEFLEAFPVFRSAPTEAVEDILSVSSVRDFPSGLNVYHEGDACKAIAFLLSGEIKVFKSGEGGREITLYEIGRGETCILNASCILSGMDYPANAVSVEAGRMLLLPAPEFRRFMDRYDTVRNFVFRLLSERLTSVMSLVEEVTFRRMDERLMEYIVEKSEDGMLRTTHQSIASDLGTSREVVTRLLKHMQSEGRVRVSRNLIELLQK